MFKLTNKERIQAKRVNIKEWMSSHFESGIEYDIGDGCELYRNHEDIEVRVWVGSPHEIRYSVDIESLLSGRYVLFDGRDARDEPLAYAKPNYERYALQGLNRFCVLHLIG